MGFDAFKYGLPMNT